MKTLTITFVLLAATIAQAQTQAHYDAVSSAETKRLLAEASHDACNTHRDGTLNWPAGYDPSDFFDGEMEFNPAVVDLWEGYAKINESEYQWGLQNYTTAAGLAGEAEALFVSARSSFSAAAVFYVGARN